MRLLVSGSQSAVSGLTAKGAFTGPGKGLGFRGQLRFCEPIWSCFVPSGANWAFRDKFGWDPVLAFPANHQQNTSWALTPRSTVPEYCHGSHAIACIGALIRTIPEERSIQDANLSPISPLYDAMYPL